MDEETNEAADNYWTSAFDEHPPLMAHAPSGREHTRFVTGDITHGVRLIDASDPKAPVVTPLLQLDGHPQDIRVTGDRALVVAPRANDDYKRDLAWLSLSPTQGRTVLQRTTLPSVHGLYTLRATATSMTVVVVTDELRREPDCVSRTGTTLRQLELSDDGIYETATRDLGVDVEMIRRSGDWLLVQERPRHQPETARFVRIRNGSADLQVSDRYPGDDEILDFHGDQQGLRIATRGPTVNASPPYTMTGIARMETLRVSKWGSIERTALCEHTRTSAPHRQSSALVDPLFVQRAVFTADRTLLLVHERVGSWNRMAIVDSKTCAATRFPGGLVLATATEATRVLTPDTQSSTLDLRVYDPEPVSDPRPAIRSVLDRPSVAHDSRYRGRNTYFPHEARVHTAGRAAWLAVPFRELDRSGALRGGTQLFELKKTGPVAGAKLDGMLWLVTEHGRAALRSPNGLQLVQLRDGGAADLLATLDVSPMYSRHAVLIDRMPRGYERPMVARVRAHGSPQTYDPHADAPLAQLEIVAGHEDANFGRAFASFPISGDARLHRVGTLLVAISQATRRGQTESRGACHVTVIDVAAKPAPAKVGFRVDDALCTARDLLEEQPAFAVPGALVFVRPLPRLAERTDGSPPTELAFYVLDLRKPEAPTLLGPYRQPGAKSLRFHDGLVELLPEPFLEMPQDPAAYPGARTFSDEAVLDAREDELLLLRYGSLRRVPRNAAAGDGISPQR